MKGTYRRSDQRDARKRSLHVRASERDWNEHNWSSSYLSLDTAAS